MRNSFRFLVAFLLLLLPLTAHAQYFGRNKVQWEAFHFKTLRTEHFDIYYYEQEADVVNDIGRMAERWYARLSKVFQHSFTRKPIVLYANSADFQQTTTTGGIIGEGTGGFTDEFMNRVVLPLTGDYAENDHVLGHEIVHVFQYDIASSVTRSGQGRRRFNLEQLPLWLVEGMAEYFSKGRIDPLTAMWIRDATINDRLPDLKKITRDPRYFPYRYGEAILAYIGARFGDEAVVRYFLAAGTVGIEPAFERAIGLSSQQVFDDWRESARELYNPLIQERPDLGNPLIGKKPIKGRKRKMGEFSELNVGPTISPDGRYVAFLSTRELFDINLYLADAHTGQIIRKLVSSDGNSHYDALRFIDSAGGWSPDSKSLAFVVFEKGDNYLGIVDVETRRIEHIRVPGVDSLTSPVFSPDGRTVAFSGQTTGVTDLFLYNLDSKTVRRLTNDKYADLEPTFSPDGRTIAFVTDRGAGTELDNLKYSDVRIATIDVQSAEVKVLPLFEHGKHINPQFSPDGQSLYFIATPEGVPDVYRYSFTNGSVARITHVETGISGITEISPALSVAARTGDIAFSLYEDDNYNIYTLPPAPSGTSVSTATPNGIPRGAVLPPLRASSTGSEITAYLLHPEEGLPPADARYETRGYSPSLHLAYLGPPTLGVAADRFGSAVAGTVSAYYTDILGQQNVGFTVEGGGYTSGGTGGSGAFADQIGADVFYLNQKNRFNWGADVQHVPYVGISTGVGQTTVPVNGVPTTVDVFQQIRQVETIDQVSGLAQYPFSGTRRIETSAGFERFAYKVETDTILALNGQILSEQRERQPGSFTLNLERASTAFVGDSSIFGFISPVRGTRYRYEIEALRGDLKLQTALADYRRYFFFRPVTIATRGLYYGRYGHDQESDVLPLLYLGDIGLVRGYDAYSLGPDECVGATTFAQCPVLNRLIGSRIAMTSLEVRAPLLGVEGYGLINAAFLPTEIFGFVDAGAAWHAGETPKLAFKRDTNERVPVTSAGFGLRILLSYIPIEVYVAKPFQRPKQDVVYGFNIIPGW